MNFRTYKNNGWPKLKIHTKRRYWFIILDEFKKNIEL